MMVRIKKRIGLSYCLSIHKIIRMKEKPYLQSNILIVCIVCISDINMYFCLFQDIYASKEDEYLELESTSKEPKDGFDAAEQEGGIPIDILCTVFVN